MVEKYSEDVRKCSLFWHCHKIFIRQKDKLELNGYGTFKMSEDGILLLDFVCLSGSEQISSKIPNNPLDEDEKLHLIAHTIDGKLIYSEGFSLSISINSKLANIHPLISDIALDSIVVHIKEGDISGDHILSMQFHNKFHIPFNKRNEVTSTMGGGYKTINQMNLDLDNLHIEIIQHEAYTEVKAVGGDFDIDLLKYSILFYLSFSTGRYPQEPYIEYRKNKDSIRTIINSTDRKLSYRNIPKPVGWGSFSLDKSHRDIFYAIYNLSLNNEEHFDSIYSHWECLHSSFLAPDFHPALLSVCVAIEGILNDLYKERVSLLMASDELKDKKKKIQKELNKLSKNNKELIEYINKLKSHVGGWGNMYPIKILQFLKDKEIITEDQFDAWDNTRNSVAHPKRLNNKEAFISKNRENASICLSLFYRIILNYLAYDGIQYTYYKEKDTKDEKEYAYEYYPYINIF